jgi:hypothetical protein
MTDQTSTDWRDWGAGDDLDRMVAKVFRVSTDRQWSRDAQLMIEVIEQYNRPIIRHWSVSLLHGRYYRAEVNNIYYVDLIDERGLPQRGVRGVQGLGWGDTPAAALAHAALDWKMRIRGRRREKTQAKRALARKDTP